MKEKCVDLAIKVSDNIFVKLAKVLPSGMSELNKLLGFRGCNSSSDIFHHIANHLEAVVYFITSLF